MITNENPNIKLGKILKMKMNKEFKEWSLGVFLFLIITFVLYSFNRLIFPELNLNYLEWFGILMFFVIIKTGIDTFNSEE